MKKMKTTKVLYCTNSLPHFLKKDNIKFKFSPYREELVRREAGDLTSISGIIVPPLPPVKFFLFFWPEKFFLIFCFVQKKNFRFKFLQKPRLQKIMHNNFSNLNIYLAFEIK